MFVASRFLIPALALLAAACSKREPSPAQPASDVTASAGSSAQPSVAAKISAKPAIGGQLFLVGEDQCELAVYADGRVEGLVLDASGNALPPEQVSEFSAALSAEADARPRVKLLWDADAKRFRGQADVQAALTTRPIDVTLQIDGKAQTGVLEGYALLPAPAVEAKAVAQGDATLKAPKPSAKLGASAKALADTKVQAPKIKAPNAAASLQAKAAAQVAVPKPKLEVGAKASAGTGKKKSGAGVKAKATFGFGN
jgi:hypothetical protein